MITMHDNESETRWNRGELQVELRLPNTTRPMGYCDGTEQDEHTLQEMAEAEGTVLIIHKKRLKTGREIWTLNS